MSVDYEQQLLDNEAEKKTAIDNSNASFDKTISDYQTAVDNQQQQLEAHKTEQIRLQKEQTDFAIEQINQQKEQAEKDYTKEQQAAYGDYKRQTDPYGANAEQMAALGLSRSGYSESSNVAMYTAYQNRVAAARASIEQAKLTFDNAIREAKLTNDINLAKIAQETLEKRLAISMESIVYLGNLEQEKAAAARSIDQTYYNRAQDIRDAQKEAMENGSLLITGDGNADFTAIDAFFGDGVSDETVAEMIAEGIIVKETINGVDVYKVADEEKAKSYLAEHFGSTAPENDQGTAGGQTGLLKYTDEYTLLVEEYEAYKKYLAELREMYGSNPGNEQQKSELQKMEEKVANYPLKPNTEYPAIKFAAEQAKNAYYKANEELQKKKNPSPSEKRSVERRKEEWEALEEKLKQTPEYLIVRKATTAGNAGTSAHSKRNWYEVGLR